MRIDRLLFFLRLARTRSVGAGMASAGTIRCNARRVTRASQPISPGDILTIPIGREVRIIEVLELPVRRGPPREAQGCYRVLDPTGQTDLAAGETYAPRGIADP